MVRYYSRDDLIEELAITEKFIKRLEEEGLISHVVKGRDIFYPESERRKLLFIVELWRDMGINIAGIDVILYMRERMIEMQKEMKMILEKLYIELRRRFEEELRKEKGTIAKIPGQPISFKDIEISLVEEE